MPTILPNLNKTQRKKTHPITVRHKMLHNVPIAFEILDMKCSILKKVGTNKLDLFKYIPLLKTFTSGVFKRGTFLVKEKEDMPNEKGVSLKRVIMYRNSESESCFVKLFERGINTTKILFIHNFMNSFHNENNRFLPIHFMYKTKESKDKIQVGYPFLTDYVTLTEYIERITNVYSEEQCTKIIMEWIGELCSSLVKAQKFGFMHRDLHCNNIMIHPDKRDWKFVDLDFAFLKNKMCGTISVHTDEYGDSVTNINKSQDIRTLFINILEHYYKVLPTECLLFIMYICQNVSMYLKSNNDPIFHDTYKDCISIHDENFYPENVLNALKGKQWMHVDRRPKPFKTWYPKEKGEPRGNSRFEKLFEKILSQIIYNEFH